MRFYKSASVCTITTILPPNICLNERYIDADNIVKNNEQTYETIISLPILIDIFNSGSIHCAIGSIFLHDDVYMLKYIVHATNKHANVFKEH